LKKSNNKQLKQAIKNKGVVYGVVLRLFGGILDMATQPHKTFGDEIAGRIRVIACLDVMPNMVSSTHFEEFGLTKKEVFEKIEECFGDVTKVEMKFHTDNMKDVIYIYNNENCSDQIV
jgi:Glu-tRNA(Gln) amidotransferase subunit E-like FAD-binding protein